MARAPPGPRPVRARDSGPAVSAAPARPSLGLVGSSPHWLRAVADSQAAFVAGTSLHLLGGAGVGKRTLVEALHRAHGAGRRLKITQPPLPDSPAVTEGWLHDVGELLAVPSNVLVLRDVHLSGDQLRQRLSGCDGLSSCRHAAVKRVWCDGTCAPGRTTAAVPTPLA